MCCANWEAAGAISCINSSPSMVAPMVLFPVVSHHTASFPVMSSLLFSVLCPSESYCAFLPWSQGRLLPSTDSPLSSPSALKGTAPTPILSLTSSSFKLLSLMFYVLYSFFFLPSKIHFNFPEDKQFSFCIPLCCLPEMHDKFSLNVFFHWQLISSLFSQ